MTAAMMMMMEEDNSRPTADKLRVACLCVCSGGVSPFGSIFFSWPAPLPLVIHNPRRKSVDRICLVHHSPPASRSSDGKKKKEEEEEARNCLLFYLFSFISVYSQQKNENDKPPALQLSFQTLIFSWPTHARLTCPGHFHFPFRSIILFLL